MVCEVRRVGSAGGTKLGAFWASEGTVVVVVTGGMATRRVRLLYGLGV
jgi:hypothetical protein